jgi:enoyl-CoA hydratase
VEDEKLLLTIGDGIAQITINRPEVRNALDGEMWGLLRKAIDTVGADDSARVLIITGSGDQSFAAGADIRWLHERSMLATLESTVQQVLLELEQVRVPTIAAVNGYALGGGCELALACDLRIASDRAKFGQPEARLGIIPAGGGTQRLVRLVGVARAKELIFTGAIIDAAEAERIGLVNRVVAHDELMASARELAGQILKQGPLAVQLAKMAINAGIRYGPEAGFGLERLAQTVLFGTEDRLEGTAAFLEKRRPNFQRR